MNEVSSQFSALADPTRRAILLRLATGEATVLELAAPFAISQPAISRHLRVLEEAGLITRRVEGTRRPCALAPEGIAAAIGWLESLRTPPAPEASPAQKKKKKRKKSAKA